MAAMLSITSDYSVSSGEYDGYRRVTIEIISLIMILCIYILCELFIYINISFLYYVINVDISLIMSRDV